MTERDDTDLPSKQELERWLEDPPVGSDPRALDALFAEVERRVANDEARFGGRLRSWPTPRRRGLVVLVSTLLVSGMLLLGARPDLGELPLPRLLVELFVLAGLFIASASLALRPAHLPSLSSRAIGLVAMGTVLAAFAFAALPPPRASEPSAWLSACFPMGLAAGLPVYALMRLLDRETPLSAVLAAAAAGLVGNLVLTVHCPITDRAHLLVSHAPLGLAFLAAVVLGRNTR